MTVLQLRSVTLVVCVLRQRKEGYKRRQPISCRCPCQWPIELVHSISAEDCGGRQRRFSKHRSRKAIEWNNTTGKIIHTQRWSFGGIRLTLSWFIARSIYNRRWTRGAANRAASSNYNQPRKWSSSKAGLPLFTESKFTDFSTQIFNKRRKNYQH